MEHEDYGRGGGAGEICYGSALAATTSVARRFRARAGLEPIDRTPEVATFRFYFATTRLRLKQAARHEPIRRI